MAALSAAVAAGDALGAKREAHTVKGLAAGGGAIVLAGTALKVESLCHNDRLPEVHRLLPELTAELERASAAWRAFLEARDRPQP
jgi:HPt (histidine-containing phosphotransfer) domain-containing protein